MTSPLAPAVPLAIEVAPGKTTTALVYAADVSSRHGITLVLAHGAGAGQFSPLMVRYAEALRARGVDVVTFDFLYVAERRRIPDRTDVLEACYRAVIDAARSYSPFIANRLFVGGKSMGGRMASHVAAAGDDQSIQGLVFLGYPLHPPGKPEQRRDVHLPKIRVPMLFVHGTRDPFGSSSEMQQLTAGLPLATLHLIDGGDHSLTVRKTSANAATNEDAIQETIVAFLQLPTRLDPIRQF